MMKSTKPIKTVKKKSKATKETVIDELFVVCCYMNDVLESSQAPTSIYKFCKSHGISETLFYSYFASFEILRMHVWRSFFTMSLDLCNKNKEFPTYDSKEQLLMTLFTFFELLTANRSYLLIAVNKNKKSLEGLKDLKELRKVYKKFIAELSAVKSDKKTGRFSFRSDKVMAEGAWLQLLFLIQFWLKDTSPSFEKTDVAIEKSVQAMFELVDLAPLTKVLDFGKFLVKEVV